MDEYLTTDQISQRLGVRVETVRRWVHQGKLSGLPLGRAGYRIRREDFDRFVQGQGHLHEQPPLSHSASSLSSPLTNREGEAQMEAAATLILERMTDGLLLFGFNGQCLYANEAVGRLLSVPLDELPGKTIDQILPRMMLDSEKSVVQDSNDYFSIATSRWYQLRIFAMPQGRCVSFLDITERKQLEAWLNEGKQHFTTLVEHLPDVVFRLDLSLRHLYISSVIEHIMGQPPEVWLGKTGREMGLPAEACDRFETLCQQAISGEGAQQMEFAQRGRWYRSRILPEYAPDGSVYSLMGITDDITERKHREFRTMLLAHLTEAFSHLSSQEELLQATAEQIAQYFDVSRLTFIRVNEAVNELVVLYDSQEQNLANAMGTQPLSDYASEEFLREMREGQAIIVNDVATDPRTAAYAKAYTSYGLRAYVFAPYVSEGRVDFVISLQHNEPYQWQTNEIELLRELAERIYPQLERVRAEQALRKSHAKMERQQRFFETVLANIRGFVYAWNRQHRFVYANPASEQLWSVERGSAVGKTLADLEYSPELIEILTPQIKHVFETGEDVTSALPYTNPIGIGGYFDYIFSPVIAADGTVELVVGISYDTSEHRQMELALRDAEQRVQAERQRLYDLFMQAPAAIMVTKGPQHIYELLNPLAMQLLGMHRSYIGKPGREAIPEAEEQGFFDLLDTVYQTGKPFIGNEMPAQFVRNGDETLVQMYFNFVYQPSYNTAGEIDGVLGYISNVTELIQARKRVEESEERLRALASSMPQLAWSARADGAIDFFNERLSEYAEVSRDEEGIYAWQAVLHPDDRAGVERDWKYAMSTSSMLEHEERLRMKDGTYRWHLARGIPTYDANGSVLRWYGTKTDIEQLKQLERQRTDFLGVVSHELKTPVTSAKAFAEVLEYRFRKAGDEKNAVLLGKMHAQMQKLTLLIADLLDVTRIEAGKLQFHEDFFSFDDLVETILEEVQRTTVHMLQKEGTTGTTAYGDRERIGQVLTNLLTNAIKYSSNASTIVVTSSSTEQEVMLCVQDFGIGIASDKLPHVFERFFRENEAHEDTFSGLGLGLYVAAEIIRRQGGRIWVESKKGSGSTFCFTLPLQGSKHTRQHEDLFVKEEETVE